MSDVHDFFDETVLPELIKLVNEDDSDETKFEKFLKILRISSISQSDRFKSTVIRTLLDPFEENQDFYKTIQDIFVLLSENQLEKLIYLDDNNRVSIDFNVESPE